MKRILVTGSSGFLGSALVSKLLDSGNHVLSIARETTIKSSHAVNYQVCLLTQTDIIQDFNPQIVINLATYSSSGDDLETQYKIIDSNIVFLSNLLLVIKHLKIELFINTGTFAEYFSNDDEFDPAYFYSATKTAGRFLIKYFSKSYSFKTVSVVPYSIYGPNDKRKKLIHALLDSLESDLPVKTTEGKQVLDFVYIDDVVRAYSALIDKADSVEDGLVFRIGTGKGVTIRELVIEIELITGKKANILWGEIPYRKRDIMLAIADITTAKSKLDWEPECNLHDGLSKMLKIDQIIN
jgi:nucleoside-diphosphate-sugar epimerase